MVRTRKLYPCLALLVAIICFIFLSNCGGVGNSSLVPNTNPTTENPVSYTNPTPTPVLSNVSVSGYIYCNNITTEDGETIPRINVMDVPAYQNDSSGNESFLTQVSNSIKADYPEDWATSEVQELYTQLNKTLSESKPLPEYNVQAQVYSVYNDTSIPVSSDGHFDNTVLAGSTDSTVKLEVALGEDNYAEVETLPSSGDINSSDATSAAELKSCPGKIFAFPGEIVIFKVYSEPGINLKSAGLKFTLNNPSIGCITQPVYLCIFGAHKYQVAYGCLYIKNGLNTPVDTTITAKTNNGLTLNIFTEVIKKTASISGTVYTGGMPLVKGFVHSLGPKACCKLDSNGAYTLPKVFRGHGRSVIATWWTTENGKKVRHREEKVIDFFDSDVTGFNFGVPPTPTPTSTPTSTPTFPPPTDKYYDVIADKIIDQKLKWQQELGTVQGIQKTAQWLNGNITDTPLPSEIAQSIQEAEVGEDPYTLWFTFKNGIEACICDPVTSSDVNASLKNKELYNEFHSSDTIIANSNTPSYIITKKPALLLGPNVFEDRVHRDDIFGEGQNSIRSKLADCGYDVKSFAVMNFKLPSTLALADPCINDVTKAQIEFYDPIGFYQGDIKKIVPCKVFKDKADSIPTLENFTNMDKNGVIFIKTHGTVKTPRGDKLVMMVSPWYLNDPDLNLWLRNNQGSWAEIYTPFSVIYPFNPDTGYLIEKQSDVDTYYKGLGIKTDFIAQHNNDFSGSLVCVNACDSWELYKTPTELGYMKLFENAWVFMGISGSDPISLSDGRTYNIFNLMFDKKSAREAYTSTINNKDKYPIDTGNGKYDNTYLRNDLSVIVYKERFIIKDETIDELKKEIVDNEKLKTIESLKNQIFSQDELISELKHLSFNDREINIILNHAVYKK